jgi:hypothetical protein
MIPLRNPAKFVAVGCMMALVLFILAAKRPPPASSLPVSHGRVSIESLEPARSDLTDLVMVAGHSVCKACNLDELDLPGGWMLSPGQKGQGKTFLEHIQEGVDVVARNPKALLVFSGGETRQPAGPRSEAQSYYNIADLANWFGHDTVRTRVTTEEHARDSFENILFSLCRFHEFTGNYPERITIVSFASKEQRFRDLHLKYLKFPGDKLSFIGINPEYTHYALTLCVFPFYSTLISYPQTKRSSTRLNTSAYTQFSERKGIGQG